MNDQYYVFFHLPAIYGFLHPNPQNLRRPVKFHPPPHQLVRSDAPVVGWKVSMDFRKKKHIIFGQQNGILDALGVCQK